MIGKNPAFTALAALSLPVRNLESLALVQYSTKDFPAVAHGFSGSNFRDSHRGLVSGNVLFQAYEALHARNTVLASLFGFSHVGNPTMLVRGGAATAQA